MTNAFEIGLERHERERKKDIVDTIADNLVQDHVEMLQEIAALKAAIERMRVAGGKEEFQAAFDAAKELLE